MKCFKEITLGAVYRIEEKRNRKNSMARDKEDG